MVGEPQPNVIGVIFRFTKERANVVIVQRVCDRIPTPVRLHQTVLAQEAELVRNGRFGDADQQR